MLVHVVKRNWWTREAAVAAVRDYARGCAYAFSSKERRRGDISLHREVLLSLLGLGLTVVQPITVLAGTQPALNLLATPVILAVGMSSAAWVVHRYRRRNYPEPDAFGTAVDVALDKVNEDRVLRRARNKR